MVDEISKARQRCVVTIGQRYIGKRNELAGLCDFPSFFVVPEPATLTLAGLGGLVALVALRRKQT